MQFLENNTDRLLWEGGVNYHIKYAISGKILTGCYGRVGNYHNIKYVISVKILTGYYGRV